MPELPEVETTLRGLQPHVLHHKITQVIVAIMAYAGLFPHIYKKPLKIK